MGQNSQHENSLISDTLIFPLAESGRGDEERSQSLLFRTAIAKSVEASSARVRAGRDQLPASGSNNWLPSVFQLDFTRSKLTELVPSNFLQGS